MLRTKHLIIRKIGFVLFLFLVLPLCLSAQEEKTKTFELDNGLKVFLYERHTVPLVNLVFAVNCGSKDETVETNGVVHILEHYILFRGTDLRTGDQIAQEIRQHGAYFNAHTSRDLAFFEMSLPAEHQDFALNLQKEILFNLKLTQEELDEEKQVILEEINQLRDDPIRYATSLVYQNLFPGHAYQRPIYGNREVIENLTADQVQNFYDRYFVPKNSALAVLGSFDINEMEVKIKETCGSLENNGFSPSEFESSPPLPKNIEINEEMDVNLAYLVIGKHGPDYNHVDQYAVDVLTQILASGMRPMLYIPLSQRRLYVNSLFMNYGSYMYGGAILLYISMDPKMLKSVRREITQYLRNIRNENFSKDDYIGEAQIYAMDYLGSAKNQIRFRVHRGQEEGLAVASSLAKHMLMNTMENRGNYLDYIDTINSSDLRKASGLYLSEGRHVIVTITPKKK
jgi:predicted Zn-dependent peptidase